MRLHVVSLTLIFLLAGSLLSCGQAQPSIDYDHAECSHCRMNVVDRQFGAALVTLKGRQYSFDDVSCMLAYVDGGSVADPQVAAWYVCDHAHPGVLIDATTAFYVQGDGFRSPMRGDAAAFVSIADRDVAMKVKEGEAMDWKQIRSHFKK